MRMRLLPVEDFVLATSTNSAASKLASFDFGTKWIGTAVSDEARKFAFPLGNVKRQWPRKKWGETELLWELEKVCVENEVGKNL